jgi:hypothetical protein
MSVSEESLYFKEYDTTLSILTLTEKDWEPYDSVNHFRRFDAK